MIRNRPTGFVHDIVARLRRFFDINLPDIETIVVETKSGRIAHSIPGGYPVGFEADSLALWTHENVTNVVTNQSEIQFTKWSTRLPGPPWWLWLLSAMAFCAVVYDFVRNSRRQR